jgi:hypothetical protein
MPHHSVVINVGTVNNMLVTKVLTCANDIEFGVAQIAVKVLNPDTQLTVLILGKVKNVAITNGLLCSKVDGVLKDGSH